MVTLINKKTKKEITVTDEVWKNIQNNEVLQNAFKVGKTQKPKEVAALEAKQEAEADVPAKRK